MNTPPPLADWAVLPQHETAAGQPEQGPDARAEAAGEAEPNQQPNQPSPITPHPPAYAEKEAARAEEEAATAGQPAPPQTAQDEPWDAGTVDPDDIPACPNCGSYEQWENLAGTWRCMNCEPPHKSNLLARKAARFRRLTSPYRNAGDVTL